MDAKSLARLGAVAFVGIAITVAAIESGQAPRGSVVEMVVPPSRSPRLEAELLHCQAIGQAGASDADCLAAWAKNRRRFFGLGDPPAIASDQLGSTPDNAADAASEGSF